MNLVPFRLHKGMFVAQAARKSIEPAIRGGAWRLFRVPVQGTRPGGEFGLGSRHTASRATVSVRLRQATPARFGCGKRIGKGCRDTGSA